ncbi:unnamed protein product [Toxocara canis]|uniref:Myosin motor domain-containing protein n=1 Tax=Toxocara canis TaxID=6265 RepID=A0A183UEU5_TOXCA|nr:unnamed protein product [Toxocara canis]
MPKGAREGLPKHAFVHTDAWALRANILLLTANGTPSFVRHVEASRIHKEMFSEAEAIRRVWVAHPTDGFTLGIISDIHVHSLTVQPINGSNTIVAQYEEVFPAEDDCEKDVDDNCSLMYLNEATLLNNCRQRYLRRQFYTYVANILIAINPYEPISDLYEVEAMETYRGKSIGTLPPHIFAIADNCYRDMLRLHQSQSIIVSGESGAGKTESQKQILRYLCHLYGEPNGSVQQRILETNPILESFGNAKTDRNNNSSRFGKFVEVRFGKKSTIVGGMVSHYLLEKSRICGQNAAERNYHIFYQLIAGADNRLWNILRLHSLDTFSVSAAFSLLISNYLNKGCAKFFANAESASKIPASRRGNVLMNLSLPLRLPELRYTYEKSTISVYHLFCFGVNSKASKINLLQTADLTDNVVDDYTDFARLVSAISKLGLRSEEIDQVFECVAAVLHLGNIHLVEKMDGFRSNCAIDSESEPFLTNAAFLLGVDVAELRRELLTRIMQPTRGGVKGTLYLVPLKMSEACAARDALAKAIYSRLFDKIVTWINSSILFDQSNTYIGVLDTAGFEFFTVNSFEQFCINFCNEKLQNFFNERILRNEHSLYEKEGIHFEPVEYSDNQDCINLFESKPNGLFTLLDDEARLPRPSHKHFTASAHQTPRFSTIREQRGMPDDDGFIIRHYAASVCYDTRLFLEKNNDSLHISLNCLMEQSTNPLVAELFRTSDGKIAMRSAQSSNKLVTESVSRKFRRQLDVLIKKLRETGTHFIRCIKPNSEMMAAKFDGAAILDQLKCAGMASVVRMMQAGFPSRTSFGGIYELYRDLLSPQLAILDPRLFCKCLFHALGLNEDDFAFGLTKVFFRASKFAEFDRMLHQDKDEMLRLVTLAQSWLRCVRWRKVQYGVLCVVKLQLKINYRAQQLLKIQSHVRGMIARRAYLPRITCLKKVRALSVNVSELTAALNQLCEDRQAKWMLELAKMKENIDLLVDDIKRDSLMSPKVVKTRYERLVKEAETLLLEIRKQTADEENEKVRRMKEAMEMEKERERLRRQKEEQEERERIQKEVERVQEEQRKEMETAEIQRQKNIGHSIEANRPNREIVEVVQAIASARNTQAGEEEHLESVSDDCKRCGPDLMKWKYEDLRKAIANSKDMFDALYLKDAEFSAMCKAEYHRRVRAYYEWKQKNDNRKRQVQQPLSRIRMSPSVVNKETVRIKGNRATDAQGKSFDERAQRFFKVPLSSATVYQRKLLSGLFATFLKLPRRWIRAASIANSGSMNGESVPNNGIWYGHFDGRWIRREMIVCGGKSALLRVAGRDDGAMCAMPLEDTLLTQRKGAEIVAQRFDTVWKQYGGQNFDYKN